MSKYYSERIVAFVDILGFKNMVQESIYNEEVEERIQYALKRIHRLKTDLKRYNDLEGLEQNDHGIEVTTFSDSAVISYPVRHNGGFFHILMELIFLQLELAHNGILLRGGIAIGDLYHDGDIVYGTAMNEAYYLESVVAKYPRIVVKKKTLVESIKSTRLNYHSFKEEWDYIKGLLRPDKYGLFFLDMLNQSSELNDCGVEYYLWLSKLREVIIEGLRRYYKKNLNVFEKYKWLKRYFNDVVTNENAFYPVPDDILAVQRRFREGYAQLKIKKSEYK